MKLSAMPDVVWWLIVLLTLGYAFIKTGMSVRYQPSRRRCVCGGSGWYTVRVYDDGTGEWFDETYSCRKCWSA